MSLGHGISCRRATRLSHCGRTGPVRHPARTAISLRCNQAVALRADSNRDDHPWTLSARHVMHQSHCCRIPDGMASLRWLSASRATSRCQCSQIAAGMAPLNGVTKPPRDTPSKFLYITLSRHHQEFSNNRNVFLYFSMTCSTARTSVNSASNPLISAECSIKSSSIRACIPF